LANEAHPISINFIRTEPNADNENGMPPASILQIMKIAQLARQLRKSIKEYTALEKTITQFAESAEIAVDQNLVPEFENRLQELYRDWEALRLRIGTLTEELQQCIANGDLEKEPRKTSS
jgi:chemotaxis regulatin CheY-phosphate phosphatase CheZ